MSPRGTSRAGESDILSIHSAPRFAARRPVPRLARFAAPCLDIDLRPNPSAERLVLTSNLPDAHIVHGRVLAGASLLTIPIPDEAIAPRCAPGPIDGETEPGSRRPSSGSRRSTRRSIS